MYIEAICYICALKRKKKKGLGNSVEKLWQFHISMGSQNICIQCWSNIAAKKKIEIAYFYSKTWMASSNVIYKLDPRVADDGKMEISV